MHQQWHQLEKNEFLFWGKLKKKVLNWIVWVLIAIKSGKCEAYTPPQLPVGVLPSAVKSLLPQLEQLRGQGTSQLLWINAELLKQEISPPKPVQSSRREMNFTVALPHQIFLVSYFIIFTCGFSLPPNTNTLKRDSKWLKAAYKSQAHPICAHFWASERHPVEMWVPCCEYHSPGQ